MAKLSQLLKISELRKKNISSMKEKEKGVLIIKQLV